MASSVIEIMAQRLIRVNCGGCRQPWSPGESVLADAGITPELAAKAQFAKGKGCNYCQKKGYRGRLGIYELMMVTAKIRELIFKNASSIELRKMAQSQGMRTLYLDGVEKVMKGITTLEEVYRVAKKTEDDVVVAM